MNKEKYQRLFNKFNQLNVLILGDVMVDSYLWGSVNRISPEAPVPVVSVTKRENRLGGAANVALNVKSMGANPILCSVVGNDVKGNEFINLLHQEGMETRGIVQSMERITTTKFRVLGNKVQMLRVDEEVVNVLNSRDKNDLLERFRKIIEESSIDVIIFQDYDKGVIDEDLINTVVTAAHEKNIPVTVDPKKKNFSSYKNISLFKPNLKELREGLNMEIENASQAELSMAASKLRQQLKADIILITLSESGIFVDYNNEGEKNTHIIPSHVRSISDVSGAGDTVISVASLCLALHVSPVQMATISNLAGGLVCEKAGVVPIDKEQLLNTLIKI
ncbi:MAG: bifunctional ADP-heptose synthase [Bacteroidales bacterium]